MRPFNTNPSFRLFHSHSTFLQNVEAYTSLSSQHCESTGVSGMQQIEHQLQALPAATFPNRASTGFEVKEYCMIAAKQQSEASQSFVSQRRSSVPLIAAVSGTDEYPSQRIFHRSTSPTSVHANICSFCKHLRVTATASDA